jgi:hypothetical protein
MSVSPVSVHPFKPIYSNRITINSAKKDIQNADLPNKDSILMLNAIQPFLINTTLTDSQLDCLENVSKAVFNVSKSRSALYKNELNTTELDLKSIDIFESFIFMAFEDSTLYYSNNRSIFCPKGSILYCKNIDYKLSATFKKENMNSVCFFIYN